MKKRVCPECESTNVGTRNKYCSRGCFLKAKGYRSGDSPTSYTAEDIKRFWGQVEKTDGCWNWTGCAKEGYGRFSIGSEEKGTRQRPYAHRFAWELAYGSAPPSTMVLCHKCDNPRCVRVSHIFLGTDADNAHDRDRKGRTVSYRGSKSGQAKLNEGLVMEIRRRIASGDSNKDIASQFGVTRTLIYMIRKGKAWAHLPDVGDYDRLSA